MENMKRRHVGNLGIGKRTKVIESILR